MLAVLEGYARSGRAVPRESGKRGPDRVLLPSLVTAKLAVYETMTALGRSEARLARELDVSENSIRRLLDLRHSSHMRMIDETMAKTKAELPIDLPPARSRRKAA